MSKCFEKASAWQEQRKSYGKYQSGSQSQIMSNRIFDDLYQKIV